MVEIYLQTLQKFFGNSILIPNQILLANLFLMKLKSEISTSVFKTKHLLHNVTQRQSWHVLKNNDGEVVKVLVFHDPIIMLL